MRVHTNMHCIWMKWNDLVSEDNMRDIMGIQRCVEEVAYITYIYHTIYSCNNN